MAKRGRKKIEVTPALILKAEVLAATGLNKLQVAASLGFCYDTLREREKSNSEFSSALKKGQAAAIAAVTNRLYELAMSGNLGAICFFLKNRAGWRDTPLEHSEDDSVPESIEVVTVDGRKPITKESKPIEKHH